MNGLIFTLVEDAVVADHGESAWDAVVARAGVDGVHSSPGTERHPEPFSPHDGARSLLWSPDDVVDAQVRALRTDAHPPVLELQHRAGEGLRLHYLSQRRLCSLAEQTITGTALHSPVVSDLDHPRRTRRGADHRVTDAPLAPVGPGRP